MPECLLIMSIKINFNVMQFKKHFSSNLQNLAIKKTSVMQPPPQLHPDFSINSQLISSRTSNSPMERHRHCISTLIQISPPDKENCVQNNLPLSNISECRSSNQYKSAQRRMRGSPLLTFQAIKESFFEQEDLCGRKVFMPIENNKLSKVNKQPKKFLKQSNSHSSLIPKREQVMQKNVRLGSMVFSSLSKNDQRLTIPTSERKDVRAHSELAKGKNQWVEVQCMNKDGYPAKYKVTKLDGGDDAQQMLLHYCFNCSIPLVKQGFNVEELSQADKQRLNCIKSNRSSKQFDQDADWLKRSRSSRNDQDERIKKGQQLKSKVMIKINKVKVSREEFDAAIANSLQGIDYFYDSMIDFIQQQRLKGRREIIRIKNAQKTEPQLYEQKLSSALGTMDYLIRHPQGLTQSSLSQVQMLLEKQIRYPELKLDLYSRQGLELKIQRFEMFFNRNLKLSLSNQEDHQIQNCRYLQNQQSSSRAIRTQSSESRDNHFRFSFESALEESRTNQGRRTINSCYQMNPLQEENESELEDSMQCSEHPQDAFRNLFPEENQEIEEEQFQRNNQSPVFKQF